MITKKLFIGTLILAAALVVSAFSWVAINSYNVSQATNSTTLSANEVSAYRWNAIADFYASQAPNSTTLSAFENALNTSDYISRHPELFETLATSFHYGPPGR